MGQSAIFDGQQTRIDEHQSVRGSTPQLSIFRSELGWFGLWGAEGKILALTIGHISSDKVREAIDRRYLGQPDSPPLAESDWLPELRVRLSRYALGEKLDFSDCQVQLPRLTAFQRRVVNATRRIAFGQTITYGELAARCGSARAARAVGNVMASNRVAIIIPCHRVIAAKGRLGGFSAPQGVSLKQRMLAMEAAFST